MATEAADVATSIEHRQHSLKTLYQALAGYPKDSEDDSLFRSLFDAAQTVLEINDSDLSDQFGVSRPTISRWAAGQTAPHPMMRKAILDRMRALVSDREKFLARRPQPRLIPG